MGMPYIFSLFEFQKWPSTSYSDSRILQRLIFWVQAPLALILGPFLYLAIPSLEENQPFKLQNSLHKLARVDYAGAFALVRGVALESTRLSYSISMC